jgi:Zinc carboxypeptidase
VTVLLDEHGPRTLDALVPRLVREAAPGARVEAWVFEDGPRRRAAQLELAGHGITAVLRSPYKALMHFFLEETDMATLRRVTVRYPVCEHTHEKRFLLETYPLAGLLREVDLRFIAGDDSPAYLVDLEHRSGTRESARVFVPHRVRRDPLEEHVVVPTGWVRITAPGRNEPAVDEPLTTEYETIYERVMEAVRAHDWGKQEPYFDQLVIRADIPDVDVRLAYGDECLSTAEALHEDLYFSILEFFKQRAGRPITDRTVQPGQIVPDIRQAAEAPRVRVIVETAAERTSTVPGGGSAGGGAGGRQASVDDATAPLALAEVRSETAALPGRPFGARSRQGRDVLGLYRPGRRSAIVITAGQHANETTGVAGALRAARRLSEDPDASFAVIPLENPDGYALHRWLCETNPRHMHHAARYTALGDDLGSRAHEPWYEKAARLEAQRVSGARFHVNLHGYPAHEWTRPLTGYLPRGFQTWSIPKGFYLIARHHRGWASRVHDFLERVTARLAQVPGLRDLNRAQLALYEAHTGERPAPILHDIPCEITQDDEAPFPLALVTEFPDETVYGQAFVLGHTVQMEAALAAEQSYSSLAGA